MKIEEPCNLEVPAGATPMTIADAILRECDKETLDEVLYYIDCFLKKYGYFADISKLRIYPLEKPNKSRV